MDATKFSTATGIEPPGSTRQMYVIFKLRAFTERTCQLAEKSAIRTISGLTGIKSGTVASLMRNKLAAES